MDWAQFAALHQNTCATSSPQKGSYVDSRLAENRSKCPFCHVACVMWNRDLFSCLRMTPYLMATGAGPIKLETKRAKSTHYFTIGKSCEAPHSRNGDRHSKFTNGPMLVAEYWRKRITVLKAGFNDFSGKSLGNFDGFSDAAAFRYQPWNIRACSEIAAILEAFDANANRDLLNFCQVFLPPHGRSPLNERIALPVCTDIIARHCVCQG